MTPQQILDELAQHGFSDTDITSQMNAINAAIRNIAYREPWPFMQKVVTLTFDGTNPYPISPPSDLRAVMKIIDTTTGNRVKYLSIDDMEEKHGAHLLDQGVPVHFYFEGTQLRFWQVPPASQTLRLRYLAVAPAVAQGDPESAIIIPEDYSEAIVLRAAMRLYLQQDDTDMASPFKQLFDEVVQQMTDAMNVQQYDEPDYIHAIDIDDYDYDW